MAASKIDIANMALTLIGTQTIAALTSENDRARTINRVYDHCRRAVLRLGRWNFAKAHTPAVMSQLSGDTVFGWEFVYQRPANCIYINRLYSEGDNDITKPPPFEEIIAPVSGNRAIVTDLEDARAIYTFDFTDTSKFDDAFTDAFIIKLAATVALPLTGDKQIAGGMSQQFSAVVSDALRLNYSQFHPKRTPTSSFEDAR